MNACADDREWFYFPFAEANFGGQIFEGRSSPGEIPGRFKLGRTDWPIRHDWQEISAAIEGLFRGGFLQWRTWRESGDTEAPFRTDPIPAEEMDVYRGYACITFDDHIVRFGRYGPHEFYRTDLGARELDSPRYQALFAEPWQE